MSVAALFIGQSIQFLVVRLLSNVFTFRYEPLNIYIYIFFFYWILKSHFFYFSRFPTAFSVVFKEIVLPAHFHASLVTWPDGGKTPATGNQFQNS